MKEKSLKQEFVNLLKKASFEDIGELKRVQTMKDFNKLVSLGEIFLFADTSCLLNLFVKADGGLINGIVNRLDNGEISTVMFLIHGDDFDRLVEMMIS